MCCWWKPKVLDQDQIKTAPIGARHRQRLDDNMVVARPERVVDGNVLRIYVFGAGDSKETSPVTPSPSPPCQDRKFLFVSKKTCS